MRHSAGVGPAAARTHPFARNAADFQALRARLAPSAAVEMLPGELLAAAFLHLVDPADPGDAARLRNMAAALRNPATDRLEAIIALDWCFEDLDPAARRDFLLAARADLQPLTPADSPLAARPFRQKLVALALAIAIDETDDPSPSWHAARASLLAAGRQWCQETLPAFVATRGLSPTSSAAGPREESDTVLALELAAALLGPAPWHTHGPTVGRWLEHYLYENVSHPSVPHGFLRDDGDHAPLSPVPAWTDLLPLTAHLLAARTGDAAALGLAQQLELQLRSAAPGELASLWRWLPIAFAPRGDAVTPADLTRMPPARNFGGLVIFRGGAGSDTTAIAIDAAQPFLRRRQHFDAGHFLVHRGGRLVVSGGADVGFEAVPNKGGRQRLGTGRDPFDFEQYFTSTLAHNAIVLWDPLRVPRWYGALYLPLGGQRCLEHTCTDFATPPDAQGRATGRQLAYGYQGDSAYLALDLLPAYDRGVFTAYTREFVFCAGRVLVVIDRVGLPRGRAVPTWILNIPAAPQVNGAPLAESARIAGVRDGGGVWRYDGAEWLRWVEGDGALWLTTPLPAARVLRLVGGPAQRDVLKEGRYAGTTYIGGGAETFEHLIVPAERQNARNAWYQLGQPTLLGPDFGRRPHWGRVELEPATRDESVVFLTVLVSTAAGDARAPRCTLATDAREYTLSIAQADDAATLQFPRHGPGGVLAGPDGGRWELPRDVQVDSPLPRLAAPQ